MVNVISDDELFDRQHLRDKPEFWSGVSTHGMVTSAHYKATEAGTELLKNGGNAVDAAIAVSVALGVSEPNGSGLGGMTMMMIHWRDTGKTFMVEGPCRAPVAATPEKVALSHRKLGYQAVAVPSNPSVLGYVNKHYASVPLSQILEPAYRLAENGIVITPLQNRIRNDYLGSILKGNAARFILSRENRVPDAGETVTNKMLASTIRQIVDKGFQDYYSGEIGQAIVRDMTANDGFITEADMSGAVSPTLSKPIRGTFYSWEVNAAPPPCGGMVLLEMLNLFEAMAPESFDPDSPAAALLFAAIIRKTRRDRKKYRLMPLDLSTWEGPDLTGKEYALNASAQLRKRHGLGETTHFNVMDRYGNMVAVTQSIERSFGAKVATPELGFLYNGFMKGFKIENKRHPHYLQPGAIARSNSSPTIIFENGKPKYMIGSTGSERMVSGIFQVLVRLYFGQSPYEAVSAPRLHCTPDYEVHMERSRFSDQAVQLLTEKGFQVIPYDSEWSFSSGGLHMLAVDNNGQITGVADPRRDGYATGP